MEDETVVTRTAQRLLYEARAELARVDEKASSALGAISALVAVVAVVPSEFQPGREVATWGWICGLSICALATGLLMLAALSRFTIKSRQKELAHFSNMSRMRNERDLSYIIEKLAEHPIDAILSELGEISKIIVAKHRLTWAGILLATIGGTLLIMSVVG